MSTRRMRCLGAHRFHDSLLPMKQIAFFNWANLLDLADKERPRAFNFFYEFHSFYGLAEGDLCPSERLMDIGRHSDCDYQKLIYDVPLPLFLISRMINSRRWSARSITKYFL